MDFLEKDLEDIIYDADQSDVRDKGLKEYEYNKLFRQLDLGGYGISDLIGIEYLQNKTTTGYDFILTIYEFKKDQINMETFNQSLRYLKGAKDLLKGMGMNNFYSRIVMVGRTIDISSKSSFSFLAEIKDPEIYLYTYLYDIQGLVFKKHDGYYIKTDFSKKINKLNPISLRKNFLLSKQFLRKMHSNGEPTNLDYFKKYLKLITKEHCRNERV